MVTHNCVQKYYIKSISGFIDERLYTTIYKVINCVKTYQYKESKQMESLKSLGLTKEINTKGRV